MNMAPASSIQQSVLDRCSAPGTIRQLILKQMAHPVRRIYTDTDCLRWSMDITRALVYLHSGVSGSMILHRDLNPDNIMLTSKDPHKAAAKLVDFGLHTTIAKSEDCSPDGTVPHTLLHCSVILLVRLHQCLSEAQA